MAIALITLTELLALLFMMRFYMRCCLIGAKAPLASFIAKATNPITKLLNPFLPNLPRIDLAALFIAYGLVVAQAYIISSTQPIDSQSLFSINIFSLLLYAGIKLIKIFVDLLFFAVLAKVILSWVSPNAQNPVNAQLFSPLTDWILEPIRRIIPTMGMIDFSPLIVLLGLQFLENFIIDRLLGI